MKHRMPCDAECVDHGVEQPSVEPFIVGMVVGGTMMPHLSGLVVPVFCWSSPMLLPILCNKR